MASPDVNAGARFCILAGDSNVGKTWAASGGCLSVNRGSSAAGTISLVPHAWGNCVSSYSRPSGRNPDREPDRGRDAADLCLGGAALFDRGTVPLSVFLRFQHNLGAGTVHL